MKKTTEHIIEQIAEKTWCINEFFLDAIFVIEGEEKTLVLDTGTGVGDLKSVIERITSKPYIVALTHGHVDHAGGVRQFDEIYVHPDDYDMTTTLSVDARRGYAQALAGRMPEMPFSAEDIDDYGSELPKYLPLEDGMVFDLGGRRVTVMHIPGHTLGSCVFIDDKSRILFSGDAANPNLLMQLPADLGLGEEMPYRSAPIETALRGLKRVAAVGDSFDKNYNGHVGPGAPPLPDDVLDNCIKCFEGIIEGSIKKEKHTTPYGQVIEGGNVGNVYVSFREDNIFE